MLDLTQLEALITQLREIERDYKTKRALIINAAKLNKVKKSAKK